MISDVCGSSYEERMRAAGLVSLEERRKRGDMIETYKTMRGYNRMERDSWFRLLEEGANPTRSNTVGVGEEEVGRREVVVMERASLEVRRNFYTVRVQTQWNEIPEEVKAQKSVNSFKNQYEKWRQKTILRMEVEGTAREVVAEERKNSPANKETR